MTKRDPVRVACELEDRGRHREAFRTLLAAARVGDSSAFVNLGYAYDTGRGVRRSRAKAVYWYRRAAVEGDASGAHNLATVYRDRGDVLRTIRWLRRAILLGDSGSNLLLGQCLLGRLGDPRAALACFKAIGPENSDADVEAGRVWVATVESMLAEPIAEGGTSDRRGSF